MDNKIEIAVITNRSAVVIKWLEASVPNIFTLGFALAVYDSSPNDEVERWIKLHNQNSNICIKYRKFDSSYRIDDKFFLSIIESKSEYVFPIGDSRLLNFREVKEKISSFIENKFDFISLYSTEVCQDGKVFTDSKLFFKECFWFSTLLGGLIYKKSIFDILMDEEGWNYYINKYNRNDGFSNNGVFFDLIAEREIQAIFLKIQMKEMFPQKNRAWLPRFMEVWCDNLCYMFDQLSVVYKEDKDYVLRKTWKEIRLDSVQWCYKARKSGGLSKEIYEFYDSNGLLARVTDKIGRVRFFATQPIAIVSSYYFLHSTFYIGYRCIRKVYRILMRRDAK